MNLYFIHFMLKQSSRIIEHIHFKPIYSYSYYTMSQKNQARVLCLTTHNQFSSVHQPSTTQGLATPWTYFLHW